MQLKPTDGHIIAGVVINDHRFTGRVKAAQLFQIAPDPRHTENRRLIEEDRELQAQRRIREEVQRLFQGAKASNVPKYAQYIVSLHHGENGLAPNVILYSEKALKYEETDEGGSYIQIPWGVRLVAIDGETQLAARFEAANITPETADEFVPVDICHGRPLAWARQSFHDLNVLSVRPNAALSLGMDARDPITRVTRALEERVAFFRGRVNKSRRQLPASDEDIMTLTTLRGACVTFAEGIRGVQYGAKPVVIDPNRLDAITEGAIEWFEAVTKTIGKAIEDREHTLASSPAAFAAIGAMGHIILSHDSPTERSAERNRLLDQLRAVNWTRGKAWEGIAGKFTPKGTFSVGGSKETAYAVFSALIDPNDGGYDRIRKQYEAA